GAGACGADGRERNGPRVRQEAAGLKPPWRALSPQSASDKRSTAVKLHADRLRADVLSGPTTTGGSGSLNAASWYRLPGRRRSPLGKFSNSRNCSALRRRWRSSASFFGWDVE